jgi:hypothetical protein
MYAARKDAQKIGIPILFTENNFIENGRFEAFFRKRSFDRGSLDQKDQILIFFVAA